MKFPTKVHSKLNSFFYGLSKRAMIAKFTLIFQAIIFIRLISSSGGFYFGSIINLFYRIHEKVCLVQKSVFGDVELKKVFLSASSKFFCTKDIKMDCLFQGVFYTDRLTFCKFNPLSLVVPIINYFIQQSYPHLELCWASQ